MVLIEQEHVDVDVEMLCHMIMFYTPPPSTHRGIFIAQHLVYSHTNNPTEIYAGALFRYTKAVFVPTHGPPAWQTSVCANELQ